MKIILCDSSESVCRLWKQLLKGACGKVICIHHGKLSAVMKGLEQQPQQSGCTAIVSPGNSFGYLGGGFDLGLREYFGGTAFETWLRSSLHKGYHPVGSSTVVDVTGYGRELRLNVKYVIFTPTVVAPCKPSYEPARAVRTGYEPVFNATWNSLTKAPEDVDTIVMPGMCTGYVGVPATVSCKSMAFALRLFILGDKISSELKNALIMFFLGYPFKPFWSSESVVKECASLGVDLDSLAKFDVEHDSVETLIPQSW